MARLCVLMNSVERPERCQRVVMTEAVVGRLRLVSPAAARVKIGHALMFVDESSRPRTASRTI